MGKLPRLIKANQPAAVKPVEFIDTLAETQKLFDAKREEIDNYRETTISRAKEEYKNTNEKAQTEGYEAGYQEGLAKATAELEAKHEEDVAKEVADRNASFAPALKQFLAELKMAREQWLGEWEQLGLKLACVIAGRVVRRAIAEPNDIAQKTLAESLSLVGRCPKVTVYMNPTDAETLDSNPGLWDSITRAIEDIQVEPDPNMMPGGCRIESEFGIIDATIETQLGRIENELLGKHGSIPIAESPALVSEEDVTKLPPLAEATQPPPSVPQTPITGEPAPITNETQPSPPAPADPEAPPLPDSDAQNA